MSSFFTKRFIRVSLLVLVIGGLLGVFIVIKNNNSTEIADVSQELQLEHRVIGLSVEGREIEAYSYSPQVNGDGNNKKEHLVFVGGVHGGYEWNSVLLAYRFIDYLKDNLASIPDNLAITVIPSLNPDGVYKVIKKEGRFDVADVPDNGQFEEGRFNANGVDLNRNFDCKWKPESTWRQKVVSAGSSPFSEPETLVFKKFVSNTNPTVVVFWHSQANAVYASECEYGVLPGTLNLMNTYSKASGYSPVESFDSYEVTGDAEGWLASINIPAITVELKTHETIEWSKNLAGIEALFNYYSK